MRNYSPSIPLQENNTRSPDRPCKYYQFGQIVKETNRQYKTLESQLMFSLKK